MVYTLMKELVPMFDKTILSLYAIGNHANIVRMVKAIPHS